MRKGVKINWERGRERERRKRLRQIEREIKIWRWERERRKEKDWDKLNERERECSEKINWERERRKERERLSDKCALSKLTRERERERGAKSAIFCYDLSCHVIIWIVVCSSSSSIIGKWLKYVPLEAMKRALNAKFVYIEQSYKITADDKTSGAI